MLKPILLLSWVDSVALSEAKYIFTLPPTGQMLSFIESISLHTHCHMEETAGAPCQWGPACIGSRS